MLGRLITLALIIGAAYWYWTGPYQERSNPSYETRLRNNAENMRECLHALHYRAGATGENTGNAEEQCARRYNLYRHEGEWHSYDDARGEEF